MIRPLWIIDLCEREHSRLRECLASINQEYDNCWIYTQLKADAINKLEDFRQFQDNLIKEACAQINRLFERSAIKTGLFSICVLGDITTETTRSILPYISFSLKNNWPKVLPDSISQGIKVSAIVYIPTNVNQQPEEAQKKYQIFLETLNLFHDKRSAGRFDYLIPFGDIQSPGKLASLTKLNQDEKEELIFQFLLNLYFTSTESGSLLPPNANNSFIGLGAASFFYDAEFEKKRVSLKILGDLLCLFREKQESDSPQMKKIGEEAKRLMEQNQEKQLLTNDKLLQFLSSDKADIAKDLEHLHLKGDLHPLLDFYKPILFPHYYKKDLKNFPALLNEYIHFYINALERDTFARIQKKNEEAIASTADAISQIINAYWENTNYNHKSLLVVETLLKEIISQAEDERKKLGTRIHKKTIDPITIPNYLKSDIEEIRSEKNLFSPKAIIDNIKALKQKEPTLLSGLVRCLLLGTTGVFSLIPLLKLLSPNIINLGQINNVEPVWIILIFLIPFLHLGWWKFHRLFRQINKFKNRLLAYALNLVYGKASDFLLENATTYYNNIIEFCEQKLEDLNHIREKAYNTAPMPSPKYVSTLFNKPIMDFFQDKTKEERIAIGNKIINIRNLTDDDKFTIINKWIQECQPDNLFLIPKEKITPILSQAIESLRKYLYDKIILKGNEDIGLLIKEAYTETNQSPIDWKACFALAFPCGVFIDSISQSSYKTIRVASNPFLSNEMDNSYEYLPAPYENKGQLFLTTFQIMERLEISRFLNKTTPIFDPDKVLTIELACYYAYFSPIYRQGGRLGSISVSYERLCEIDKVLSK